MRRFSISNLSIKIWVVFLVALLIITLWFVITLSNTASRITVVPQLFSPDVMKFNHLVETTNMQIPVKEAKLIDEMLIRFYIENRNEYIPNLQEMSYRYGGNGPIARLSSPAVYNAFQAQIGNFAENMQDKTNVATKTIDITRLVRQDNVFTVDFDIYHFDGFRPSYGGTRRATVQIRRNVPQYRRFSTDFANPYGVVVVSYRETPLKKH